MDRIILRTRGSVLTVVARLWQTHVSAGRKRQLLALLLLMLLSGFAEIASLGAVLPFLAALSAPAKLASSPQVGHFMHGFGIESTDALTLALVAAFCMLATVAGLVRLLVLWASTQLAYKVASDLSNDVYRRTLYQPYRVHVARNSSEIISGITVKVGNVPAALQQVLTLISSMILLICVAGALLWIDAVVAIMTAIGFGTVYGLVTWAYRSRLRTNSQVIATEKDRLVKILQEGLGGIRDILLDHSQELYCQTYRSADKVLRRSQISNVFIGSSPRILMETCGMVLIASIAYALTRSAGGLEAAVPVLGALALGAQRMLPALQQAYGSWVNIAGNEASLRDVLALLDQPLAEVDCAETDTARAIDRSIRLQSVRYAYGEFSTDNVIDGISFTIPKGTRLGLVGGTGSGKSTLVDLLMGLIEPSSGMIFLDDQPMEGERLRSWQRAIGHVPQHIFLADASVAENIAFGVPAPEIDQNRVRQAARQAQIADYIEACPDGYRTIVGERGVRLSGGQRQRIGIARALYRRASVLFFDEATSALDGITERAVMDAIEALDRTLTVIIVAHRISTLRACDIIVEIGAGRVVAQGRFDELVAHSASFRRMAEAGR